MKPPDVALTDRLRPEPAAAANRRRSPVPAKLTKALRAIFNCLALNLVLLIACLPVVTVPAGIQAATVALENWRRGEDRVVRVFLTALSSAPFFRTTMTAGLPLGVAATGLEEVHFFSRGGGAVSWLCLGFGAAAVLLALASLGFVLVIGARQPGLPPSDVWHAAVRLAVRTLPSAGLLSVIAVVAAALLLLLDPPLALVGVPLGLVAAFDGAAARGLRRIEVRS